MQEPKELVTEKLFDAYCKRVLKNKNRDLLRHERYLTRHETPLQESIFEPYTMDAYFEGCNQFQPVRGITVIVHDEWIAQALTSLNADMRNIVLLSYFLDLTDKQIASVLDMKRSTVQFRRSKALAQLAVLLRPYYE